MATTPPMPTRTAPTPDLADSDRALVRCVGDVGRFFADHYGHSPFLWTDRTPDDLLSLAEVDRQLTGAGLRRPSVRGARNGEPIDPSQWTRSARTGNTHMT